MKLLLLLVPGIVFSHLAESFDATSCPIYQCQEDTSKYSLDQCFNVTTTTYFLRPCQNGYSCSSATKNCTWSSVTSTSAPFAYLGEPCNYNLDCIFGQCTNKVCTGLEASEVCKSNDQCNPGLFCNSESDMCQEQYTIGQVGCFADTWCENGAGCNTTGLNPGTCIPYLTLDDYTHIGFCSNNINQMCQSGGCITLSGISYCLPSVKSAGNLPVLCSGLKTDCASLPDSKFNNTFYQTCSCGYNNYGASYCGLFPGDQPMIDYVTQLKKWYESTEIKFCNTQERLSLNCMKNY